MKSTIDVIWSEFDAMLPSEQRKRSARLKAAHDAKRKRLAKDVARLSGKMPHMVCRAQRSDIVVYDGAEVDFRHGQAFDFDSV